VIATNSEALKLECFNENNILLSSLIAVTINKCSIQTMLSYNTLSLFMAEYITPQKIIVSLPKSRAIVA
jgi:hypothetical protein